MAVTPFPVIGRPFKITPDVDGLIAEFGPADMNCTGTYLFDIVPDVTFDGQLSVMGKFAGQASAGAQAHAALVAAGMAGPIPYRGLFVNGAPVTLASDQYPMLLTPITGRSIIMVPSNALSIGFLVACTAGFCWIFSRQMSGSAST